MNIQYNDPSFKAVHALGNGHVCAYFKGVDLIDTFGPTYSVPTMCTMSLCDTDGVYSFFSSRTSGTAIWQHTLYKGADVIGTIIDFVPPDRNVLVRRFRFSQPVSFQLKTVKALPFQFVSQTIAAKEQPCFACEIKEGTLLYRSCTLRGHDRGYVIDQPYYLSIASSAGGALMRQGEDLRYIVSEGTLVFGYSEDFMDAILLANGTEKPLLDDLYHKTTAYWQTFTAKRQKNVRISDPVIEKAADDVAVLIKAQQAVSGGILAGYNYHLSYVRDNYGTMRGLLAMGCQEEALALAAYYREIFGRKGKIHNAQGMANDTFHVHENDDAEITGYLVLMMTDVFEAVGDQNFFRSMLPLLRWCILEQHANLRHGMLPFNGDETYIAGGLIPRSVMDNGSMEASLLFHTACKKMLQYQDILNAEESLYSICRKDTDEIERYFAENFIRDSKIACNNPEKENYENAPRYRAGGVMQCGHGFGPSFLNKDGLYVCIDCVDKDFPPLEKKIYFLNSVALMPRFIHSALIDEQLLEREIDRLITAYKEKGSMPTAAGVNAIVGYDLGLFINALPAAYREEKEMLLQKMLSLRDAAGAWVEYYLNDQPENTMCRPWESGINIMAAVKVDSERMVK